MNSFNVVKIQLSKMREQDTQVRKEAARLWNRMVKLHRYFRKRKLQWPKESHFKKHFKGRFKLYSSTVQAIIEKFFSNIDTARTNRRSGDKKAKYPYHFKGHFNVLWKEAAIKVKGSTIFLSMGRGRKPLKFHLPEIPEGKVVYAELGFHELRLTLKRNVPDVEKRPNIAAADLGNIHLSVITDGKKTISVVGRGLRSINQKHNKKKAVISKLLSKCKKGSRRWKKLKRSLGKSSIKKDNQQRNLLHHAANIVTKFCGERDIGELAVGDITNINKNKKGKTSKRLNQENGSIALGKFVEYLKYKLKLIGCEVIMINEAYTTRTCPVCGNQHKPAGRTYRCKNCGGIFARDEVGAVNILNKYINGKIKPGMIIPTNHIKYLRPVKLPTLVGLHGT